MTKKVKREIVLEQEHGVDIKKAIAETLKKEGATDSDKLESIKQLLKTKTTGVSVVGTLLRPEKLMDTKAMPLKDKLGAIILGGLFVNTLKESYDSLVKQLEDTPLEEVTEELIKEGVLEAGETPVITVIDRAGAKHSCSLGSSTSATFNMEEFKKYAEDPDIFDALPDEYKEVKVRGAAFFKKLFTADALGAYKKYFSLESETLTKLKKERAKPELAEEGE